MRHRPRPEVGSYPVWVRIERHAHFIPSKTKRETAEDRYDLVQHDAAMGRVTIARYRVPYPRGGFPNRDEPRMACKRLEQRGLVAAFAGRLALAGAGSVRTGPA